VVSLNLAHPVYMSVGMLVEIAQFNGDMSRKHAGA